jgi:CheY-like chemotaxis protein
MSWKSLADMPYRAGSVWPAMTPQACTPLPGILVVDDDEHVRAMLSLGLRQAGFRLLLAADGHEVVEQFLRHQDEVRVVLLDVHMPGLDGPGALARIHRVAPQVPCCFMTGYSDRYTVAELKALGATCVFAKPFRFDEVLSTLTKLCGRAC